MNDVIVNAVNAKISELEQMATEINTLKAKHKAAKEGLAQSLAFLGLRYVPCTTCKATGKVDGETCPDCNGLKVQLIPLDAPAEPESDNE